MCELYSVNLNDTSINITAGNCVNGERFIGERPNFVLFYPDTVRAEYLSTYDFPFKTTPRIDEFAKEGVTFMNHIAQHSECSPSRIAMLTGRYMHNGGKRTLTNLIQHWEPNYLRWLKDSGYYVLFIGKNDAYSIQATPLAANEWIGDIGVQSGNNLFKYGEPGYYSFLYSGGDSYGNDTKNGDYKAVVTAQNWLETNGMQPFVIFLPGRGGHPPYGAPKGYQTMFDPKEIEKTYPLRPAYIENKPSYYSKEYGIPHYHNFTSLNFSFFYQMNAVYLGMLSYMDWNFGQLVDAVRTTSNGKFANNTVIFMTSDHGDYSGDHRMVEKWPGGMDDSLIHIPLVASIPNSPINGKSIRVKTTTQSFDIGETMMDLANINRTYVTFGTSLKDYLMNGETKVNEDKLAFSEGGFYWPYMVLPCGDDHLCDPKSLYYPKNAEEQQFNGTGCPRVVAIRNVNYKIVYRGTNGYDISEFYDLKNDPKELNNLFYNDSISQQLKDAKNRLMSNLTNWYLLTADITPILTDPRGLPPAGPSYLSSQSILYGNYTHWYGM